MSLEREEKSPAQKRQQYCSIALGGLGFGLLLGDLVNQRARRFLAFSLTCSAAMTYLPVIVNRFITGPKTKIGTRRILKGIRRTEGNSQADEIGFVSENVGALDE